MLLKGTNGSLELEVVGYEFPDHQSTTSEFDYDANWLIMYGDRTISGQRKTGKEPCIMTTEIRRLVGLLDTYQKGEIHEIEFGTLEPNFWIHMRREQGQNAMEVFFWFEHDAENYKDVIPFKTVISDLEIREFKMFWEQTIKSFPVR